MRLVALTLLTAAALFPAPPAIKALRDGFTKPPDDARIMMRWWWFGPAVDKQRLEREMRLMKEGGIGGFEVQPVYPLELDDPSRGFRNAPFLSPEFLDALRFTAEKARELGLRMDLTLGSGWPYGGPSVSIAEASGRLRIDRVKIAPGARRIPLPPLAHGEKFLAAFAAGTNRNLTDIRDGVLWLAEGDPAAEVWFFIESRTGMMVKRPAYGAEGYVMNHYDRAALDSYLQAVGGPLLKALAGKPPYAIFCDSLEVYGADWTEGFLEEFRRRRGYDLKAHLPSLAAEIGPHAAIRHDWGRTLTELHEERFLGPLHEWAKAQGTQFRLQGYGLPPATISSNAHADLPEGEGSQWKTLRASRWAASASHIYGRPVTSSETWTWLHSPVFRATPLDMKAEADLHFLQGINQLIGHGWPYTPEHIEYPGWRFYAAAVFNEKNPWWIVMPDIAMYLQRMSFLMRQGRPANDIALYLSNSDAWSHFSTGRVHMIETQRELAGPNVIPRILEAGYNLDFIDEHALDRAENRYKVMVLPGVETLTVAAMKKLEAFAKSGGTLIATRRLPSKVPGFRATEAEHAELKAGIARLFEGASAKNKFVADESLLGAALQSVLAPDVALTPAAPEIGFVHRSTDDGEIYFVANSANTRKQVKATFRVSGIEPEWWDPMTGEITPADVVERRPRDLTLELDLEPYGSRVVVFSREARKGPAPSKTSDAAPPIDLSRNWRVSIGTNPPFEMDSLVSWTEDERTRYYSGAAAYERTVNVPAQLLQTGASLTLDFGDGVPVQAVERRSGSGMRAMLDGPVREAAVVYVNGRRAGSVWTPPYKLVVTKFLQPGENKLRIVVANLAINHMSGRRQPDYRLLNLRYGERFQAQDMDRLQPLPSGLLGPVRLVSTVRTPSAAAIRTATPPSDRRASRGGQENNMRHIPPPEPPAPRRPE